MPWYDDAGQIEQHIGDMSSLRALVLARSEAARERDHDLEQWIILRRFFLRSSGGIERIVEGAPSPGFPDVCNLSDPARSGLDPFTCVAFRIPDPDAVCRICLRGWTIRNLHDHYRECSLEPVHASCRELEVIQRADFDLRTIVKKAGVPYEQMRLIPSQYHDNRLYYPPWAIFETAEGPLRIGWRKRVIVLDWSATELEPSPRFADEEVTKGDGWIHAWGSERATEYLRWLWTYNQIRGKGTSA